jgi:hypothetical protein
MSWVSIHHRARKIFGDSGFEIRGAAAIGGVVAAAAIATFVTPSSGLIHGNHSTISTTFTLPLLQN